MIELNGVSNMKQLLEQYSQKHLVKKEFVDKMSDQLELMERYMQAIGSAMENGKPAPYWYEILVNPKKYPTVAELTKKKD